MTTTEFWKLSKEERRRVRDERWESFISGYGAKKFEPTPPQTESLSTRFPPTVFFSSASDVINNHKQSIAKFDIDSLTEDVRSFGQSEFERGIEFALKQLNQ